MAINTLMDTLKNPRMIHTYSCFGGSILTLHNKKLWVLTPLKTVESSKWNFWIMHAPMLNASPRLRCACQGVQQKQRRKQLLAAYYHSSCMEDVDNLPLPNGKVKVLVEERTAATRYFMFSGIWCRPADMRDVCLFVRLHWINVRTKQNSCKACSLASRRLMRND